MSVRSAIRGAAGVARAEFSDRIRDRRLLVVILATIYVGHLVTVGHLEMALGDSEFRGVHNAAWLGTNMAIAASGAIAVFGFYYTRSGIRRDRHDGPRELIASSPIGTVPYLAGKWLGNLVLLLVILTAMGATAVVLFVLRGTGPFDPSALLLPFLVFSLPVVGLVVGVAIVFASTPLLRGRTGTILYLFGLTVISAPVVSIDPLGGSFIVESMQRAIASQYPTYSGGGVSFGYVPGAGDSQRFTWAGVDFTTSLLLQRGSYLALSPLFVVLAAIPFDRLDPDGGFRLPWISGTGTDDDVGRTVAEATDESIHDTGTSTVTLSPLTTERSFRPVRLLIAELKLALGGRSKLWYLGYVSLFIGAVVAPRGLPLQTVLTLAWVWPLFVWAQTGGRERQHNTSALVFTSTHPLAQLVSAWGASVLTIAVLVAPAAVRATITGDALVAVGIVAGVVMVPSLATASAVLSGTTRLFEVAYLIVWYVGIANRTPVLDFGGVVGPPPTSVVGFVLVGGSSLVVAVFARRRQITR